MLCFVRLEKESGFAAVISIASVAQCETFLEKLIDFGISLDRIHLENTKVTTYHRDGKTDCVARREISFTTAYNAAFSNRLLDLIEASHLNVDMDCECSVANKHDIVKELIAEAVVDSRAKAELVAAAADLQITGIDTVSYGDRYRDALLLQEEVPFPCCGSVPTLSDQLSASIEKLEEKVTITWIVE